MPQNSTIEIQVKKPKAFKRRYEFYENDRQVALLDYEKAYKSCAIAVIDDKKWKLRRVGFWKSYIEIIAEQSPYTKTRIEFSWTFKTRYRAENGKEYVLKNTSSWKSKWAWLDENKNPVIEIKSCQFKRENRGHILIHANKPAPKELLLLMLVGWYQVTAQENNAAVVIAATT
jgi:hypothetical protein